METIIVNSIIGTVTLLFAALAFGPVLIGSDSPQQSIQVEEDLIISIEPVPFGRPASRPYALTDVPAHQREAA